MGNSIQLMYLIGQYPAINHGYLLAEIQHLRRLGLYVVVTSVKTPDRPPERLTSAERAEAATTYYLRCLSWYRMIGAVCNESLRAPLRCLQGLTCSLRLAGFSMSRIMYHLMYFVEAVLVGREMRRFGIRHVHASFSATVALIATHIFPVTMSFGVYGYGELHDPGKSHLRDRISGALFVRSISRNGRGQLMLSCDQREWSKLYYVPLGIDPAEFPPRTQRSNGVPIQLLCVGRLAPEKGQILLLHAMAELKAAATPLHLHLVGDGPDRLRLEREAAELGVAASVTFEGAVDADRLAELYRNTDVFVLPSLAEGIPIAAMEAMAKEIPCVAPRIAGLPELIEDGVDGMLFHVADIEDLVRVIRILADSAERRLEIGQRARLRVERDYNIERNTEKFAHLLNEKLAVPVIEQ